MSRALCVALSTAACTADSTNPTNGWSEELQDVYTAVCVGVAVVLGNADPERHGECTLAELQEEYTEEEYLAAPREEKDAVSVLYGQICEIRFARS